MEQDIEICVKELIAESLYRKDEDGNQVEVRNESNFVEDLGADSSERLLMVMAVEDEFAMKIPDDASEELITVQDVINYVIANKRV
ncbi:acyl carrier protein [Pseudomonas sp. AKS31]|uniref:acyl carrier protein n=1 Tax=Pseudomonas sp. AKS31 TaxID=2949091 RepID=UPI00202AB630|nr:acyl carrier protein [Pseudomonas sp. AKS31]MCL9799056.1 acyl carrier protein [Pseudomonas sp. AKS31]